MKKPFTFTSLALFVSFSGLISCQKNDTTVTPTPTLVVTQPTTGSSVTGDAQVTLGKALFWDPILSGGKDVACATCHHPANAYTDGIDLSLGANAVGYGTNRRFLLPNDVTFTKRNSQTVLNTAFNGMDATGSYLPAAAPMFWDSRSQSLENQAIGPITTFEEMRGHTYIAAAALDSIVVRLAAIAEYRQLFQEQPSATHSLLPWPTSAKPLQPLNEPWWP